MYSIFHPVGILCQIEDVLWEIESSSEISKGRLALSGKADKASFLKDYGSPIEIGVDLTVGDSDRKTMQIANENGQWCEIGSAKASLIDNGEIELMSFSVSLDQRGFDSCVLMAVNYWRRETHNLIATAEIFGIEHFYGGPRQRDRWPSDKQLLPITSFTLFIRPKSWGSKVEEKM